MYEKGTFFYDDFIFEVVSQYYMVYEEELENVINNAGAYYTMYQIYSSYEEWSIKFRPHDHQIFMDKWPDLLDPFFLYPE